MRGENSNGHGTERVFQVNRGSKKGEALQLSLRDISPLFSLLLPKAAQKLGISPTSLKNACRHFKLPRWPGRKVRGLESTIYGLQRTAGSHGAGSGSSKEARMRSEIPKLQQELNELCHGTLEQIAEKMHSPTAAKIYKRLYIANGWRSKYHNPGRHDINAGDRANLTSGLAPASARENSAGADPAANAKKQRERKQKLAPCTDDDPPANQPTPNADQESAHPVPRKSVRPRPRRILRSSSRLDSMDTEMEDVKDVKLMSKCAECGKLFWA